MELVSIIMPAYNCSRFIREAIDSVLAQTYTAWELLIVDDCSTDDTAAIIASYQEFRSSSLTKQSTARGERKIHRFSGRRR